ncbi:response regulator transcription factor [Mahella australiensis]|uniref:Stage 0 sporulation protein A homolog n=1 Tax=Mahella australiensis (strain DSM 15567 / CIP 107919 / 50-1 BON) TaxID=697281 RepID=F3ZYN8_MAHA5|nr:response regulator [Mahella australiensis]AEE97806.1 two component transcriptional regulator, AraC family [Mahella australiensis 50-1 BON]
MIHVLIVDDDKLARKGLIAMMPWSSYGMEIVGDVPNGARALEFLAHNAVDLMFVDLAMPVMSGIELMREVRKSYPNVDFVVLTFHENFEYVQAALRLGALDYISKAELESENYDQIFSRIIRKLEGKKQHVLLDEQDSRYSEYDQETEINENVWEEIKQEWYKLYWLYDDDVFAELCLRLKENRIPMRRVEQLFIKLLVMVESATNIKEENLPDSRSIDAAIEWIKCYREALICKAVQASDLGAMPVCIIKAVAFIKENINMPIREEEVAYHVNMSRSYFSQNFKKITGLTFNDYIKKQRVSMAKKLLTDPNRTVADIAQTVGYEDVKYFSRVFYEQVHVSPSRFRQQLSTNSNDC